MHRTWLTPQEFHRRKKMWKESPPIDPFNQYANACERVKKGKNITCLHLDGSNPRGRNH